MISFDSLLYTTLLYFISYLFTCLLALWPCFLFLFDITWSQTACRQLFELIMRLPYVALKISGGYVAWAQGYPTNHPCTMHHEPTKCTLEIQDYWRSIWGDSPNKIQNSIVVVSKFSLKFLIVKKYLSSSFDLLLLLSTSLKLVFTITAQHTTTTNPSSIHKSIFIFFYINLILEKETCLVVRLVESTG